MHVSNSLLVEFYQQIPEGRSDAKPKMTRKEAIEVFKHRIAERYSEGTLLRLLEHGDNRSRRAALLALGLLGTMNACPASPPACTTRTAKPRRWPPIRCGRCGFAATARPTTTNLQRLARLRDRKRRWPASTP